MAGKGITRGTARLARVIDHLSKGAIADILLDRIGAEIGEDASDERVLAHLQPWLDTIARLRGDKPANLLGLLKRFDGAESRYLERERQRQDQRAAALPQELRMKEQIDLHNAKKPTEPIRR